MHRILFHFLAFTFCLLPLVSAQSLRSAYQFPSGKAWSAGVDLPDYSIMDIGKDMVPIAVTDKGTVLLKVTSNQLVRWTWGKTEILLDYFINAEQAFMNERNSVVALNPGDGVVPDIVYWIDGQSSMRHLAWGDSLIAEPYHAWLFDLNDRNTLILRIEAMDTVVFIPPYSLRIETNLIALDNEHWQELAAYDFFHDTDFTIRQGGRRHEVEALNNYDTTVGLVYEDQATSSATNPDRVYLYQNEYFSLNGDTALDFQPLLINDAGTILGRTLGPDYAMVILDRFGERLPGPAIDDVGAAAIRMSNPLDGLEEIVLGQHYWKRMQERDFLGQITDVPSPDFWQGTLGDLITHPGTWKQLEATCISANGRIAGTGRVFNPEAAAYEQHAFLLVESVLTPDWDRDGTIDGKDRKFSKPDRVLPFWINDDDDEGVLARSSADDQPGNNNPDWANPGIDGLRDVVDFFAVNIDLQKILQAIGPSGNIDIIIKHAGEALNFVYTNLHPSQVGAIHTEPLASGFGPAFSESLETAPTRVVTSDGVHLSSAFIDNLLSEGRGVLLFEGNQSTRDPLVLELHNEGKTVLTSTLPLSIGPVGDMFRIINLRNADPKFANVDPGPWSTRIEDPPNLPDDYLAELTNPLRTLIHVHGYNWTGYEVPAGHSEIFKRFYQSGSNARFVGVTWHGDQGTLDLTGSSFEYNENVINAFITAKVMTESLLPFSGPDSSLFAHSLGNMVASSAIVDHGLDIGHYFMTNGAVPEEAYLGSTANRRNMLPPEWKDVVYSGVDYPEFLLSPNWNWLFPSDDNRFFLKWKNRFASIGDHVTCVNFYSSGEDVLKSGNGDLPTLFGDAINRELVWVYNEMVKGTETFAANLASDIHGGWGFNRHYMDWVDPGGAAHPPAGQWVPMSPDEASDIEASALIAEPFFHRFSAGDADFPLWGNGAWLYADKATANTYLPAVPFTSASMGQLKNHAKIIAEAIPAHSDPAGSNPLPLFPLLQNIDLDREIRDPHHWPVRDDPDKRNRWLHSDYLKPALSHVAKFYLTCVNYINRLP